LLGQPLDPNMLVQDILQHSAGRLPGKVALVCGGRRLTYQEIDSMANRLAQGLIQAGVNRGDRVALWLGNSVEAVVGTFAILKAGGVFVPVNQTVKRDKMQYILNNCRAVGLLADPGKLSSTEWSELLGSVPTLGFLIGCGRGVAEDHNTPVRLMEFDSVLSSHSPTCPPRVGIDLDLACLIYTSGTTGEAKGVMCTHHSVIFASGAIISYLENVEEDIVINLLPLSFDYGLYQLLMTFRFGGTLVLENSFAFPAVILKRIEEERVTGFPGVPTIFAMLLRLDLKPYDLSSLRYLTNTAAALPVSHIEALRHKLSGARLFSMYGLTETKRTLYLPPEELSRRPGSVGIPIPGTEVWIEADDGRRLGPGEIGELIVRGRHVMSGYWEAPEETARRFPPGPFPGQRICRSGDLFRMDEDGFFYFVSRKDDIIKTRGEKVAPKEVENVICGLPGVVEATVMGVADSILGQAIRAVVVVDDRSVTEKTILAHCRASLEDYMVPKQVEIRAELPKSASGKVIKSSVQGPGPNPHSDASTTSNPEIP